MKHMKKLASILLMLAMVLSMSVAAFAETTPNGSIKISNSKTVSVEGKTFTAYKILDLQMVGTDGYVYTVPEALKGFYRTAFKDDDGSTKTLNTNSGDFDAQVRDEIAKLEENSDELFAFAAAALNAAKAAGSIEKGTVTGGSGAESVTINDLSYGYYVVADETNSGNAAKVISALMLDSVNGEIAITLKADNPSVDKEIVEDNSTTKNNNAAVGDKVPFQITSKVPDMTGFVKYYFVLNDTFSKGLTFNDDVTVSIGETELERVYVKTEEGKVKYYSDKDCTTAAEATANAYILTSSTDADGETSVEIVFVNFIQYKNQKEAAITVNYSATVNEYAVIGDAGNKNSVDLTYSNDPNKTDDGDPDNPDKPDSNSPVGVTPASETKTFVTSIELTKIDGNNNRLTGAEFELIGEKLNTVLVRKDVFTEDEDGTYWKLKDGSYTTEDPTTPDIDSSVYESTAIKYTKSVETKKIEKAQDVTYTGTVGADGVLRFEGLSAGKYTITEIKAPAGYNLLKESFTVTIGWTAPVDGVETCTWSYTWDAGNNGDKVNLVQNTNAVNVVNNAGTELPSTGGIGTTIFYVVGSILLIGAAVLLITKKRMSSAK